ncbi:hypothetical protein NQ314_007738 [Rhamnusium bicolor]|uniref:Laccase n=1 Tax=Rhamnusium bicolor TaxID=1586634 RepID=A0AAV8YID5_9CUCU|nr:hypothetical protein NQ314_007738 [Rhamnusium bicolor]
MVPGPSIQVCEGDKVVVDVENHMEGMEVTIHWHGIWQRGTQYYDELEYDIYQWIAGNAGTHFWHAHTGLQKMDGLYGSIAIRQPPSKDPNSNLYDFDLTTHVMLLSDWMHEDAAERFPGRLAVNTGQDPESLLINGKGQFRDPNTGFMTNTPLEVFTITPGRRYRFRMINSFASVCPAQLTIQGHDLTLIATDGEPVHPVKVNTIISFSGERYDFVINADQDPGAYWIQLRGLGECGIRRVQQLGILRYARNAYQPSSAPPTYDYGIPQGVVLNPLDARFAPNGDHVISLIDEISYLSAPSPLLSQYDDINPEQFCNGDNRPANCGQNCMCTHKVDIPLNAIVEVVLVDEGKDTIAVPNNGYVVLRFRADNPGFWLFHCHFLFHIVIGMNLIFQVGSLSDLPPVPEGFPTCGDHRPQITLDINSSHYHD